ncbi:MAG: AMP-binding protein [Christensenellaceae bacterium]|nr:AMP-binding protein [Christensenellaceae bacterium]
MRLIERYTYADYASMSDFQENYRVNVPSSFNFAYDVIDEYAHYAPGQRAMIWVSARGDARVFSFGDLKRLSDKAANALYDLGLRKGDAVLLLLKRRWEYWVIALALMKLGCVQIPATAQLQKKDIVYRLNASDAVAVIAVGEEEVTSHVAEALGDCPKVRVAATLGAREGFVDFSQRLESASDVFLPAEQRALNQDVMLMYFTSGTTGMPKMAAHDFTYPLGHLITGRFWHNLNERSIHLTVADSGWAKCAWGKIYGQWIAGATVFVYDFEKFAAQDLLNVLVKYRVTSFCAPPTIYRFLVREELKEYDLSSLKWCTAAGEPLNPDVAKQFEKATGCEPREGFGQSETTPLLLTSAFLPPRAGSIGVPSPHYDIRLLDAEGNDVEAGEEGEICVDTRRGHPPGLFVGYYKDAEATKAAFYNNVYHTGDMAWRDEDGYFWFIGRADDVIKSSGYRIGPFEVESALVAHPAVVECAVTGVPDPDRGQAVKATVVLAKGYQASDALKKELQQHVKRVTAPYKYPRIIEFVEELPKTVSGKIQRKIIRQKDS